jgi:hypothetical protein
MPYLLTFIFVSSKPCFSNHSALFKTQLCSIEEIIMCLPLFWLAKAIPLIARLLLSVAELVKIIKASLLIREGQQE